MASRRWTWVAAASTAVGALVVPLVATADASAAAGTAARLHVIKTVPGNYVGPLQFAIASPGNAIVADSFTSTLWRSSTGAALAHGPSSSKGGDLAGVALDRRHQRIAYTSSNGDHSRTKLTILQRGKTVAVGHLARFERQFNPDHAVRYGVQNPSSCVRKALTAGHIPVSYRGHLDSHPYAVAYLGNGSWAVADAGGNDILKVTRTGDVSLLKVMPRVPLVVTKEFAKANHLPACTIGVTYYTESVPTDIEKHGNQLYVSSLPGGPEGPGVPGRGAVFRMSLRTGELTRLIGGFHDATNIAVTPGGKLFVAALGTGRVSLIRHGASIPVFRQRGVVAVEFGHHHLYVSTAPAVTGAQQPGKVLVLGS